MFKYLLIFIFIMSLSFNTLGNDTLFVIYKQERLEKPALYTFISLYNIERDLETEIGNQILEMYINKKIKPNSQLTIKTSLGEVYGYIEIYTNGNTQVINYYPLKYFWTDGKTLLVKDLININE